MTFGAVNLDYLTGRFHRKVDGLVGIMLGEYDKCPCCGRFMTQVSRSKWPDEDSITYRCKKDGLMKVISHDVSDEEIAWGCGESLVFLDEEDSNSAIGVNKGENECQD